MKKIDMFMAKREFADRVSKYVDLKVLRAQYQEEYRVAVASTNKLIKNLDTLKGSIFEDRIPEKQAQYEADLEVYKANYEQRLEAMEKFELSEEDKALRKALKPLGTDDTKEIKQALRDYFQNFGLKITGTDFEASLTNALGGRVDMRKFVKTEGVDGVSFASGQALNLIMWVTFNYMVKAGTIKAAGIPDILKEKYVDKNGKINKAVAEQAVA